MIDCPHRRGNECQVATELSRAGTPAETTDAACEACLQSPQPRAPNAVTASLAITHASQSKSPTYREVLAELRPLLKVETVVAEPTGQGAGTNLYRMLHKAGIRLCLACLDFANAMNAHGPQWCRDHEEEILEWMRQQAQRMTLPFVKTAARAIVRGAIAEAEADGKSC